MCFFSNASPSASFAYKSNVPYPKIVPKNAPSSIYGAIFFSISDCMLDGPVMIMNLEPGITFYGESLIQLMLPLN